MSEDEIEDLEDTVCKSTASKCGICTTKDLEQVLSSELVFELD